MASASIDLPEPDFADHAHGLAAVQREADLAQRRRGSAGRLKADRQALDLEQRQP